MASAAERCPPPVLEYSSRIRLGSGIYGRLAGLAHPALHAPGELAARQQDAATAGLALQANVRPQADHPPVGPTARMRLSPPHPTLPLQPREHGGAPPGRPSEVYRGRPRGHKGRVI